MSKIAVVYWSGTGNTEAMADLVASVVLVRLTARKSLVCRPHETL